MKNTRQKQTPPASTKIILTSKEVSELAIEGIITIILLALVNIGILIMIDQIIENNQSLTNTIFNIKDLLNKEWDSNIFWSGKKFLILLFVIADSVILYWRLIRRYHQMQLRHIISELHYIASGHYNYRIPFVLGGDLGRVIDSINGLVDSTVAAVDEERKIEKSKDELITNVSHDLRTPLTSIIGYLGLIEDKQYHSEDELRKYVHIAFSKAKQMKLLVEDLFEYTKARQPVNTIKPIPFDLHQLLEQLAIDFELEANKKKMEISVSTDPDPFIMEGDPEKLMRVFSNLLTNALKYGKGGRHILMTAEKSGTEAVIVVKNDGKKIPSASLKQLFDRFYRVESSRSQETGGTGLGLAITQSIIAGHGGYIFAKSDDQWTSFIIHLPLKQ